MPAAPPAAMPAPPPPTPTPPTPTPPTPPAATPEAPVATPAPTDAKEQTPPAPSPLAEPPPEPKAAATQVAPDDKPNAAEQTDKPTTPDAAAPPPPPAPAVLTAPEADTSVQTPSKTSQKSDPAAKRDQAEQDRNRKATATLAAALPTAALSMPSTFRNIIAAQGTSDDQEYKGAVFGSLSRATQAVSEEARRRHLNGQVVVAIELDSGGNIAKTAILQSSGSGEVDAMALDLVRRAAPFPPPPPGSKRSFTPVITIGDD